MRSCPHANPEGRRGLDVAPPRCHISRVPLLVPALLLSAAVARDEPPRKVRHEVPLSGSDRTLTVDETTGWPAEMIRRLVNAANASTRDDCPSSGAGLMAPGDRVFVSRQYLAWFDYTK